MSRRDLRTTQPCASAGVDHRGVAVSLTPVALEGDSRAFRVACTLAEAGFRSVVVEGRPSEQRLWDESIEVVSPSLAPAPPGSLLHRLAAPLRAGQFGAAGEFALYAGFCGYDWWRHRRRLHGLLPDAELYYLHSFEMHRLVAPQAARLHARIIYDAHDFYRGIEPPERLSPFDRDWVRPFFNHMEDRLVAAADAVITVSDGVAALMEAAFGRRPLVIRNCHDERHDCPATPDLRTAIGVAPDDCLAVVAGNWKRGMGVMTACDAIALLPERFHLAFVGRGYESAIDALREHPAARRIHFGHSVPVNRIVPFIASADLSLVVYEPYSENYLNALPNGFFQAVAAGLPVIRGRLPEIEAVIAGRDVGASLDPIEASTLAEAIARCADRATSLRRAVAGLARQLRWQVEAERLHDLLCDGASAPKLPVFEVARAND